jgi:Amt family ammonium transporter
MNQADTAWMLISTALVLLMTPALAFFYGGLVRTKNALNTMMMSFISLGFVGVLWAVIPRACSCTASASNRRGRFHTCSSCVTRERSRSSPPR